MSVTTTDSPRKTRRKLRVEFTASSATEVSDANIETIVAKGLVDAKYNSAVDASARYFKSKIDAAGGRDSRHF